MAERTSVIVDVMVDVMVAAIVLVIGVVDTGAGTRVLGMARMPGLTVGLMYWWFMMLGAASKARSNGFAMNAPVLARVCSFVGSEVSQIEVDWVRGLVAFGADRDRKEGSNRRDADIVVSGTAGQVLS